MHPFRRYDEAELVIARSSKDPDLQPEVRIAAKQGHVIAAAEAHPDLVGLVREEAALKIGRSALYSLGDDDLHGSILEARDPHRLRRVCAVYLRLAGEDLVELGGRSLQLRAPPPEVADQASSPDLVHLGRLLAHRSLDQLIGEHRRHVRGDRIPGRTL